MNIINIEINEVIENNIGIIKKVYGDDFSSKDWQQAVEYCYFDSVKIIFDINHELNNQEENSINTARFNSQFAIAFILVSPYFQHFTKSLFLKDGVIEIETIQSLLDIMTFYFRFAEDSFKTIELVNHRSSIDLGSHYKVVHGDVWPYMMTSFNILIDKGELLKAFEEIVDELQSFITNEAPIGRSASELFAFSKDARVKAGPCYRVWVKSFMCYAMQVGSVSLSKRVEKMLSDVVIDDKKSSDYEHRKRAERLIQCALSREPLANGHGKPKIG